MSDRANAIRVGILGLGNIGSGTVEILQRNADLLERRLGAPIELVRAADLDPARAEPARARPRRLHHRRQGAWWTTPPSRSWWS